MLIFAKDPRINNRQNSNSRFDARGAKHGIRSEFAWIRVFIRSSLSKETANGHEETRMKSFVWPRWPFAPGKLSSERIHGEFFLAWKGRLYFELEFEESELRRFFLRRP